MPAEIENHIGATSEELATAPGLLTDLALSLLPRRIALADGLLTLLGGYSHEKVETLRQAVRDWQSYLVRVSGYGSAAEQYDAARELLIAVGKLEAAVFTLVIARAKRGQSIAPAPAAA